MSEDFLDAANEKLEEMLCHSRELKNLFSVALDVQCNGACSGECKFPG